MERRILCADLESIFAREKWILIGEFKYSTGFFLHMKDLGRKSSVKMGQRSLFSAMFNNSGLFWAN